MAKFADNANIMSPSIAPLKIDAKSEAENIEKNIRDLLNAKSAEGAILGLSGGIDSAVLAALAVRVIGDDRVCAYCLYDRDNPIQARHKANLIADWLRIELKHHNITPTMQKMKIYSPLIMKVTTFSGFINRYLNNTLYPFFYHESPFVSTLRRGNLDVGGIRNFFYNRAVSIVEAAFNARHIYRRSFLEQQAEQKNYLVLGAANRSELMVGWFVKGGVDDMPFSPLIGLYKTGILQLAEYLDLPSEIQNQAPSADMVKGVTDESALGICYETLDIILYYIDRGLSDREIVSKGISSKDVHLVRTMNKLSAWKREQKNSDSSAV